VTALLRSLLVLAGLAAAAALVADRWLAARRSGRDPEPLRMLEVVDAPIERTWSLVADVPRQPEWMHEMKAVRILDPAPVGPGTRAEATVRILGISVTDPVTVTDVEPPARYAIRHEGLFTGRGEIRLEAGADGSTTIVRWDETLVPPLLPELGARIQAPILRRIFQSDLRHLKRLVEAESGRTDR
jgi:uncharacterized membrane protein